MRLATRSERFWATAIDSLIEMLVAIAFLIATSTYLFSENQFPVSVNYSAIKLLNVALIIIYAAIFVPFWAKAQSPGKALLKLQVVSQATREPLSFKWMLVREIVGKAVSAFLFGAGFWAIYWSKENQCWHDKITESLVMKK